MTNLKTDTIYRAADYCETYTGRQFFPRNPNPKVVSVIDIAHHLSNQCRFAGATGRFYSTAQHCCLLARYTENILKKPALDCMQILMHDAAEAYLVDIPRPLKQYMGEYRQWDHNVTEAIRVWLGIAEHPLPDFQDEIDSRIIADERTQLMSDSGNDWGSVEPLGILIDPWPAEVAEREFLVRWAAYSYAVYGAHQYIRDDWGIPNPRAKWTNPSTDSEHIEEVVEVDLRGGVGRVKIRGSEGMMTRNREAGTFPAPAWQWVHGKFTLEIPQK
jgi:uncharacterized protein